MDFAPLGLLSGILSSGASWIKPHCFADLASLTGYAFVDCYEFIRTPSTAMGTWNVWTQKPLLVTMYAREL